MKTIGFNQPLYVLPFDHRRSFETKSSGRHGWISLRSLSKPTKAKPATHERR